MPSMNFVNAYIPESDSVVIEVKVVSGDSWCYHSRCHEDNVEQYLIEVKRQNNIRDARVSQ